jgi:hypothetical protein
MYHVNVAETNIIVHSSYFELISRNQELVYTTWCGKATLTNSMDGDWEEVSSTSLFCTEAQNKPTSQPSAQRAGQTAAKHTLTICQQMDTNLLYRQVNRLLLPPPGAHAVPTPIACLAFDNSYELLWSGNDFGRVTSFYGTELTQYTSFKAGDDPVRQILLHDKGIIALCSKCIHMAMRRGPPIWHITYNTQVLKLLQG